MNIWGVTNRRGQFLTPQAIDNLFRNSYYAGVLLDPWSGEEHQGQDAPMVSQEIFAKVQQVVTRRSRSIPHQKHRPEFPLRGLVRCQSCKRYMTGSFSRGRSQRYPYYHCGNRVCPLRGKTLPTKSIHREFEALLVSICHKEGFEEKLGQTIIDSAVQREALQTTRQERKRCTLNRLNREKKELIRMRAQSLITDEEFTSERSVLLGRYAAVEGSMPQGKVNADEIRQRLREIVEPLTNLFATWKALPDALQRRFQRLVLPVGFVARESRTAELGLLFRTFQAVSRGETIGVTPTWQSSNQIYGQLREFSDLMRAYRKVKNESI